MIQRDLFSSKYNGLAEGRKQQAAAQKRHPSEQNHQKAPGNAIDRAHDTTRSWTDSMLGSN